MSFRKQELNKTSLLAEFSWTFVLSGFVLPFLYFWKFPVHCVGVAVWVVLKKNIVSFDIFTFGQDKGKIFWRQMFFSGIFRDVIIGKKIGHGYQHILLRMLDKFKFNRKMWLNRFRNH